MRVHIRGKYDRLGDMVPRHFPVILAGEKQAQITKGSGRLELANWLGSATNQLTTVRGLGKPTGKAFVRLKREGKKVAAGWSRDGKEWKDFDPQDVAWGAKVKVRGGGREQPGGAGRGYVRPVHPIPAEEVSGRSVL